MSVDASEFSGRREKRAPILIIIYLARLQDDPVLGAELTCTKDVSAHGACIISRSPWLPGDLVAITSSRDLITARGSVVHCHKCASEEYAVGLLFQGREITWSMLGALHGF